MDNRTHTGHRPLPTCLGAPGLQVGLSGPFVLRSEYTCARRGTVSLRIVLVRIRIMRAVMVRIAIVMILYHYESNGSNNNNSYRNDNRKETAITVTEMRIEEKQQ